jgi:hypothetical protein
VEVGKTGADVEGPDSLFQKFSRYLDVLMASPDEKSSRTFEISCLPPKHGI